MNCNAKDCCHTLCIISMSATVNFGPAVSKQMYLVTLFVSQVGFKMHIKYKFPLF